MCEAQQAEGAQAKPKRASIDATKIIFSGSVLKNIISRQTILTKFRGRYSRYKWYIGTYHVYKRLSAKLRKRISKLSYISDKLRKSYPKDTILYITKELNEDRNPHYHFLIGLEKDQWGNAPIVKNVRNFKLWIREWKLNEVFTYHEPEEDDDYVLPFYVNTKLEKLDLGARQRYFKYGIYKYLLYIFKYSKFNRFIDFYIQN